MRGVIVAAGTSSRLRPLTDATPKGLLDVGGRGILERSVACLHEAGVDEILMVVGFEREQLMERFAGRARFVYNPFYRETNNMASLWFALEHLSDEPLLYLHGDLVYDAALLTPMLASGTRGVALLVDDGIAVDTEAMKVRVKEGRFVESSKEISLQDAAGEWIGIATFGAEGVREFRAEASALLHERRFQDYDTAAFTRMAARGVPVDLVSTGGAAWVEVDFAEDLERARRVFAGDGTP